MTAKTQEMLGLSPDASGVPRQELTVAMDGSGQFTSIAEALRQAVNTAIVRVRPGIYRESLVIDRPVELLADGPPGSVVIESNSGSCLLAYPQVAVISGFMFRCTAGAQGVECYGIEIQTRVFLHECDITCNSLAGVALYGPNADPILRRCRIHDGAQCGALVYHGARGRFEDCEFSGNALGAIEVQSASDPFVTRCRISGAVTVFARGRGTFEDCEIVNPGEGKAAFQVQNGDPVVRRCSIHHSQGAGVLVTGYGRGTFEECNIFANAYSGFEVKGAGNPQVRRCAIREGSAGGVMVWEYGRGTFEECEIFGNELSGVEVKEGGDPVVRRCAIHDGKTGGVMIQKYGHGVFEDCEIFANSLAGVEMGGSADPVIRRCRIHHGRQGGVLVHSESLGTIDECEIFSDARCGVAAWEKGNPLVRRSKIHDCQEYGMIVFNEGTATVEECEFWGHNGNNLNIRKGCQLLRRAVVER